MTNFSGRIRRLDKAIQARRRANGEGGRQVPDVPRWLIGGRVRPGAEAGDDAARRVALYRRIRGHVCAIGEWLHEQGRSMSDHAHAEAHGPPVIREHLAALGRAMDEAAQRAEAAGLTVMN